MSPCLGRLQLGTSRVHLRHLHPAEKVSTLMPPAMPMITYPSKLAVWIFISCLGALHRICWNLGMQVTEVQVKTLQQQKQPQ